MTPRLFWYCIRHELFYRCLCTIFISLVYIISFLTSLVTPDYQRFLITNSIVFHYPPCLSTSVSQYSQITSALNFSSFGIYTFLSFNINSSSFHHFSSLNILTPVHFISSTAFTTLLSFASDFLIFSNRSIPSITTSVTYITLTSSYFFFTNILFLLFFFIPTYQSRYLLRLLALPILLPGTYFSIKSNLDRYNAYLAYL